MSLHDRIKTQNGNGSAPVAVVDRSAPQPGTQNADTQKTSADPYGELKTKVHHACIAKLGPELFRREGGGNLSERVLRAVSEQLALDRTPLTREERRQLVREIADDILGYGPLEPLLADDSVTEIMCNGADRIYVERRGRLELSGTTFVDNDHLMRI